MRLPARVLHHLGVQKDVKYKYTSAMPKRLKDCCDEGPPMSNRLDAGAASDAEPGLANGFAMEIEQ